MRGAETKTAQTSNGASGGAVTPALLLRGITKTLGGRAVLRDLSLEVAPGETVVILGPNGAGKTTLLRVAGTLSRPDTGTIAILGIAAAKQSYLAHQNLSVLTQACPVYAELTPHEHLQWWARMNRMAPSQAEIESATVRCGLAARAHKPAGTLSRGQQQRLAIAMALLPRRALLLLDEPFAALDADGQAWLEGELATRRGTAATLLALHDNGLAHRIADRVLRLEHGALVEVHA